MKPTIPLTIHHHRDWPGIGIQISDEERERVREEVAMSTVLERMSKHSSRVEKLSDSELADKLIEKIWSGMTLGTYEEALLDEAITRIKGEKPASRGAADCKCPATTKKEDG